VVGAGGGEVGPWHRMTAATASSPAAAI
jgi:hypothetical protein